MSNPFFYRKQVSPLVSECNGFGSANYSKPTHDASQAQQSKLKKQALKKRPIAGDVYTQATNIEDE